MGIGTQRRCSTSGSLNSRKENKSERQWRGIYFIADETDGKGYVGSAYGSENILGRWRDYARTGHGGNVGLRERADHPLRFSILQRVSPDMDPAEVIELEASWNRRLHSRDLGLNRN